VSRVRGGRGCEVVVVVGLRLTGDPLDGDVVLSGWAKSEDGGDDEELDWK
jgi:hypothetical protein